MLICSSEMKASSLSHPGSIVLPPEGERRNLNSELWHACAGPLVSLPAVGSRVVYLPQGHSEQVAASTQKEVDAHIPAYPNLPPHLACQLQDVFLHADIETDEVYCQMTLQPIIGQEKESFFVPDVPSQSKQPNVYFCKTLTASDTSTHGGFSIPRRAAEKVFPSLDFEMQPPAQLLVARDLHDTDWNFRHIYRGQPKRHLLTTGWSMFVSAKRLVAGDSVLFIRDDKGKLLLGIRRASRPQTFMPSSVLSSDSMHIGVLAAAAHAANTNSRFTVFYNPRASLSEFVIPYSKFEKAVYHTRVSVGMRFRMLFETEESSVRRYMGTITGVSDLDPVRWPNSQWRCIKVGWDESTAGERQRRVSLWEIELLTTFLVYPPTANWRLRHPWPQSLSSSFSNGIDMPSTWMQFQNGSIGFAGLAHQGMGVSPLLGGSLQHKSDFSIETSAYDARGAAALQDMDPMKPLHLQQPQQITQPDQMLLRSQQHSVVSQLLQQQQSSQPPHQPQLSQPSHQQPLLQLPHQQQALQLPHQPQLSQFAHQQQVLQPSHQKQPLQSTHQQQTQQPQQQPLQKPLQHLSQQLPNKQSHQQLMQQPSQQQPPWHEPQLLQQLPLQPPQQPKMLHKPHEQQQLLHHQEHQQSSLHHQQQHPHHHQQQNALPHQQQSLLLQQQLLTHQQQLLPNQQQLLLSHQPLYQQQPSHLLHQNQQQQLHGSHSHEPQPPQAQQHQQLKQEERELPQAHSQEQLHQHHQAHSHMLNIRTQSIPSSYSFPVGMQQQKSTSFLLQQTHQQIPASQQQQQHLHSHFQAPHQLQVQPSHPERLHQQQGLLSPSANIVLPCSSLLQTQTVLSNSVSTPQGTSTESSLVLSSTTGPQTLQSIFGNFAADALSSNSNTISTAQQPALMSSSSQVQQDSMMPSSWIAAMGGLQTQLIDTTRPMESTCAGPNVLPSFSASEPPFNHCFRDTSQVQTDVHTDLQKQTLFGANIDLQSMVLPTSMPMVESRSYSSSNEFQSQCTSHFEEGPSPILDMDISFNSSMFTGDLDDPGLLQVLAQANAPVRTYTKVYKTGSVGRSLDVTRFSNYGELRCELARMFGLESQLEHPRSGWQLIFVDKENDWLLLGDDPWEVFINNVRSIKILSPSEVFHMQDGMGLLAVQRQTSSSSEDGTTQQDSRNPSSVISSAFSLDY